MARVTIEVCDSCGRRIPPGEGATMRVSFRESQRTLKHADLCDECAAALPGRGGREPKTNR
jgi:predicted RNA-binding Zn-ribbon protein involved in translation (DUF1610 family)